MDFDGLRSIPKKTNGQRLGKIRKELQKLLKNAGIKIVIETCHTTVDYLDVIMELKDLSYRPRRKPKDNLSYVNSMSDHPLTHMCAHRSIKKRSKSKFT